MRIGILGGTFNPPHLGHLLLAESARDELALDQVVFIPAWRSPFKDSEECVDARIRLEMVALAISDNAHFVCDGFEVERARVSYTVDTIEHRRSAYPEDELFLLLGADTFGEFHSWKNPERIVENATLAVARRAGRPSLPAGILYSRQTRHFEMPAVHISSTDVRQRVRTGQSIRYLVPWTVRTFIEAQGLYR